MEVGEFTTELTGRLLISELHQSEAGGACEHVAVGTFQETGCIAITLLALMVQEGDIMELFAVPGLQGAIHAEVEEAASVLHHTVHIVAGQRLVGLVLFLEDAELVAVVTIDAIAGSHPQEPIVIKIYLSNETTGQLMTISSIEFAHLCT